ncbi:MAG: tRNA pseudouridine(38-40) synthase TruA [Gemmatimonadetes bacterium]|nr:tRNA pseudouridine(38-40) synthase TruA [Gemmatimonadota bacterium]NNK49370.1 tRNA pseudouridine(38-40) synthase TruA [Gemmatimonadota bacterium]
MHSPEGSRYRATVHYDGSAFAGWQVQPHVRTVQGELESALTRLEIRARVIGAGRTDTGVHAAGQEMSFAAPVTWTAAELARALNSVLPDEVWIESLREADVDFHPRFHATGRRYEYFVAANPTGRAPNRRRGTAWVQRTPLLEALRRAARPILGRHDFEKLAKSGQPRVGTVCTVEKAEWLRTPLGDLRFTIVADRFLHHMVRYLVATMLEQCWGDRPSDDIGRMLGRSGDARPPTPADARGLYLTGVRYREGWNRPPGVPGLWPVPARPGEDRDHPRRQDPADGEESS